MLRKDEEAHGHEGKTGGMIAAGDAMDLTQARLDLARALGAASGALEAADRFRAVRQWLIARGAEALHIDPAAAPGLVEIIQRAVRAPAGPARRAFAILLVDALAVPGLLAPGLAAPRLPAPGLLAPGLPAPGLLSARRSQARLERDIRALLESALQDVLWRAGYPFAGDPDAKRRSLATLAASIDEHLRPLEPTFPAWLSGLPER
jgi:hypothetical protein